MSAYFFDTNALIKRYMMELGSVWVRNLIQTLPSPTIIVSRLSFTEVYSVLNRYGRMKPPKLSVNSTIRYKALFRKHIRWEYTVVPIDDFRIISAARLINKYPLRSLDALQLACAIYAQQILSDPLTFVSADNDLLTAASGEGLLVDNPLLHP